jgi:hypothetical protein
MNVAFLLFAEEMQTLLGMKMPDFTEEIVVLLHTLVN